MAKKYPTLAEAEEDLNIDYVLDSTHLGNQDPGTVIGTPLGSFAIPDGLSPIFGTSPFKKSSPSVESVGDIVKDFIMAFKSMTSSRLKKQLVQYLYKLLVIELGGMPLFQFVQADFLDTSLSSMRTLFEEGKKNLIHSISKCFERSKCELQTRMPLNRMPFGLIDYNLRFFAASRTQKLGIEEHYAQWLETMFSNFRHKWACLHRGPCWQYEEDTEPEANSPFSDNIIEDALRLSGINIDSDAIEDSVVQLERGNYVPVL